MRNIGDLIEGEKAIIKDCVNYRLLEHGFVPGTQIEIYKKVNGITSVYLRGAIIACRDSEAKEVYILKKIN